MRILMVHNAYGRFSGEEAVVEQIGRLLVARGHRVVPFARRSAEIARMRLGRLRAFFSGIHSGSSRRAMSRILATERPDVAHVHNVFPLISPSVLGACRTAGVPVVMSVHNFRLICPTGLFMTRGRICEKCAGGREYWCVLRNCTGSFPKSVGYALRNALARARRAFLDNVAVFATLTDFQRRRLIAEGFPADRVVVVPNMVEGDGAAPPATVGGGIGFAGRLSPEKGIGTLLAAARRLPDVPFQVAGGCEPMADAPAAAPPNVRFLGRLGPHRLAAFYRANRLIVVPSLSYEGFPMVLLEAMRHGRPAVCSRIGGLPEIVDEGVTGALFEPGDAADLAAKLRFLLQRPELCRAMGQAARAKALRDYCPERYYERLMAAYRQARRLGPGAAQAARWTRD